VTISHGVSTTVIVGKTYLFRYRGKNVHGWGPYSDSLPLIAARKSNKPAAPVTSNEATNVKITWQIPAYNGGTPLTGYRIKIKKADGSFIEDKTACNGAD